MIYLTGDVHNRLGAQLDQIHSGIDEPSSALRYARIAADAGLKLTFFVTGRAVVESTVAFKAIAALGNVEFGGHGWDSFCGQTSRTLLWCVFGSRYGPRVRQKLEIEWTQAAFRERLERNIVTWRNHALYADENTYPLLGEAGVRVVSDLLAQTVPVSEIGPGLWSVPINTMLDHDSVAHGGVTKAAMDHNSAVLRALRDLRADSTLGRKQRLAIMARRVCRHVFDIPVLDHAGERMYADRTVDLLEPRAWEARLYSEIEERIDAAGFATLLLHPVCMATLDDLTAFRRIAAFCRRYETHHISEAPSLVRRLGGQAVLATGTQG